MISSRSHQIRFSVQAKLPEGARAVGFKVGAKGAHSSRTLMADDLTSVLAGTAASARRADYVAAITDANCLGKPTASTRRLSAQRLSELYGLDPDIPLFRVFRRLWELDSKGRTLLALLLAIARDPLLAATAAPILSLAPGAELQRDLARQALRLVAGERFNPNILDKVLRNAASSWTQSGHLEGRTFKKRRLVEPTVATATYALYLSHVTGFRGPELFSSGWFAVLDCTPGRARELVLEAKRLGLIDLRIAGDVVDLKLDRLDPQLLRG
ncbi:MAG: hypothetical protein AB1651_03110 [Pseudomonadota bacterium]